MPLGCKFEVTKKMKSFCDAILVKIPQNLYLFTENEIFLKKRDVSAGNEAVFQQKYKK